MGDRPAPRRDPSAIERRGALRLRNARPTFPDRLAVSRGRTLAADGQSAPTVTRPTLSVVIPNWNGLRLLRPCLKSLGAQTWRDFETIVVDNGSSDGSRQALADEFPWVRVVALPHNLGFAGGCNAGMAAALGEIIVLLNNDTEVEPTWLAELAAALERHPEAGFAASRMMLYSDRQVVNSAGDLYRRDGTADARGVWQPYGPPWDEERLVFGASAGAAAYRRAMLDVIGLFEARFMSYCEDVDLSWRAQLAGYTCVYAPRAVIYHHGSATGGGALASYFVGRNTLWVLVRNVPGALVRRHGWAILRTQMRIARDALRAWRGIAARARLRGQLAGCVTCWRWLGHRRRLLRTRRVDDAYLESILD